MAALRSRGPRQSAAFNNNIIIYILWRARVKNAHDGLATAPQRFGTARVPCPRLLAAALPMLVAALGPS